MMHIYAGILLPSSVLNSDWFAVLAAFVAINTIIYVTLAVAKILPRFRLRFITKYFQKNRRIESRGI